MHDRDTDSACATAEDLIDVLGAYQLALSVMAPNLPGVGRLRQALGAALAQAARCIPHRDAAIGGSGGMRH